MKPAFPSAQSAAGVIARFLKARGVDTVFALCGGHIMPIWMRADAEGLRIVDVRDERAAVHMAHAYAELTGKLGVALVTAGPSPVESVSLSVMPRSSIDSTPSGRPAQLRRSEPWNCLFY